MMPDVNSNEDWKIKNNNLDHEKSRKFSLKFGRRFVHPLLFVRPLLSYAADVSAELETSISPPLSAAQSDAAILPPPSNQMPPSWHIYN